MTLYMQAEPEPAARHNALMCGVWRRRRSRTTLQKSTASHQECFHTGGFLCDAVASSAGNKVLLFCGAQFYQEHQCSRVEVLLLGFSRGKLSHILPELDDTNTAVFPDASWVLLSLLYKSQKVSLHLKLHLKLEFILLLFYF